MLSVMNNQTGRLKEEYVPFVKVLRQRGDECDSSPGGHSQVDPLLERCSHCYRKLSTGFDYDRTIREALGIYLSESSERHLDFVFGLNFLYQDQQIRSGGQNA